MCVCFQDSELSQKVNCRGNGRIWETQICCAIITNEYPKGRLGSGESFE